jgi:phthalate 3,4-dioxygenase beta subunit
VTNIRTFTTDSTDEFMVESGVLLFRSRGDINESDLISAGRRDILRVVGSNLRLAHRIITVDEAVLRTQNLALFL